MKIVQQAVAPRCSCEENCQRICAIVAASSVNLVEWFDFCIYAFCATHFVSAFFPKSDPTAQLLNTAGVFAAGFLMRPIGGWVFGRIADRRGRKTSMVLSVLMMRVGSLLIAALHTCASIGACALSPLLLLAVLVLVVLQQWLSDAKLKAWGWRIALVIGAITAVVARFLRRTLKENFTVQTRASQVAGRVSGWLRDRCAAFLTVLGDTAGGSLIFYTFTTYMQK